MHSLFLPCFFDCCLGVAVGILFGRILSIISAPMRSLPVLFHFISPFGGFLIWDGHAAISLLDEGSIANIGTKCQVSYT